MGGKPAMQALAGFVRQFGQLLEADGGVHQVAQNEAGRFGFFAKKEVVASSSNALAKARACSARSATVCLESRASVQVKWTRIRRRAELLLFQ